MKNKMKKVLALVFAGLMAAVAVVSVSAGNVLTDKDLPLHGGNISDYPTWNFGGGYINYFAKCPECGKSCYQFSTIVSGCTIYSYICSVHGQVTPVAPNPDVNPKPPVEDDDNVADYTIKVTTTRGGKVTLSSNSPIKWGDSRTVYITPNYGYICSAVYVNGYNVGALEKLDLKYIRKDYNIFVVFKAVLTNRNNAVSFEMDGKGTISAKLNGKDYTIGDSVSIKYDDTLKLTFVPGDTYAIDNVKINGVDMGDISTYTLSRLYYDVKIEVNYKWINPYVDVNEHLAAVEYVTTNDIMGSPNQFINTDEFQGNKKVNNYLLCAFLAEMADSGDVLDTHKERIEWMQEMGVIGEDYARTDRPTYAEAFEIVKNFLRAIEKENDITFTALKDITDVKAIAKKLGFEKGSKFETAQVTRYDVAEICYAIAQLDAE